MNRKDFIRLIGTGALAVVALNQPGCSKSDSIPQKDFTIDINDAQYNVLQTPGAYVYINGVIVFKAIDGNFYALSQVCTHQGCNVKYEESLNDIFCPCHGSQYDLQGKVLVGPSTMPLFQYATSLSGTVLHVFTP
ncbi:MAG TPA: ubiquinol-cytochrome c reductase iron-sulfur subunit [Chitinophagales bacterium]|nr:ubiquinol-cytochrome c reductase iron-sulfur subunit [Chitinophagales bacterium]